MAEEFQIASGEGLPIRGTLELPQGTPKAVVILIHGFKGFRQWGFFPWMAEQLAAAGIASCRFDMSRNGIGEDPESFDRLDLFADDTYSIQLADFRAVLEHVRSDPRLANTPLFLLGHSRGGAIAMLSAPAIRDLAGLIVWSSIETVDRFEEAHVKAWRAGRAVSFENSRTHQLMSVSPAMFRDFETNREHLDIKAALRMLSVPILVIHGMADETVPVDEARGIASRNTNTSLMLMEHAGHTFGAIHPLIIVPRHLRTALLLSARFMLTWA